MADTARKGARPGKPVFKLDVPYTQVQWPQLATADHDIILEMLVNLLAPIGQHRSTHITPSKGKRSKKRKRQEARKSDEPHHQVPAPPPPPALTRHITVGVNSTTRHLEQLAADRPPPTQAAAPEQADLSKQYAAAPENETDAPHSSESLRRLPLIFTLQPPSSITTSHLPLLTHMASRSLPFPKSARFVPLKPSSEPKLTAALGVPRVGVIGIMEDAPGAEPLIKYAREKVSATDAPWLREASEGCYLGVNVLTEQPGAKTGSKK